MEGPSKEDDIILSNNKNKKYFNLFIVNYCVYTKGVPTDVVVLILADIDFLVSQTV